MYASMALVVEPACIQVIHFLRVVAKQLLGTATYHYYYSLHIFLAQVMPSHGTFIPRQLKMDCYYSHTLQMIYWPLLLRTTANYICAQRTRHGSINYAATWWSGGGCNW